MFTDNVNFNQGLYQYIRKLKLSGSVNQMGDHYTYKVDNIKPVLLHLILIQYHATQHL